MEIRPISVDDTVRALLSSDDLPIDDITNPAISLWGAYDGEQLVGVIGLQALGELGLLRSLAVAAPSRSRGVGRLLCERVLDVGRATQLRALWLLTTSARDYFIRLGFTPEPRDQAPPEIRATAQFASLCPASACVMQRSLG